MSSRRAAQILNAAAKQGGVGLPAAIFVITLMAVLAVAINARVAQNAENFAEDIRLTRAFYAAESGAGLAMNRLFPPGDFPAYQSTVGAEGGVADGTAVYEFSAAGLGACSAQVQWTQDAVINEVTYYTILSTGSCGPVNRTVQLRTSFQAAED